LTPVNLFKYELAKIGYSELENDYVFSDVFSEVPLDRIVSLAAFTQYPPSYRNAALGIVEEGRGNAADIASNYRALGAPLLFVIAGPEVSLWQVHPHTPPSLYRRIEVDQLGQLFAEHTHLWNPQRIHRAKSFGPLNKAYQLDFVDAGLLAAIEGEIDDKLDRLLSEAVSDALRLRIVRPGEVMDERLLFRTILRLLAAKSPQR
jgi:hypothetical protein